MSETNKYQLKLLSADDYEQWDAFVKQSPQSTLFHTINWANLVQRVFKRDFQILVLFKKKQIVAGILFWPKKVLFINTITHIPNTSYQGPLYGKSAGSKTSSINSEYQKQSAILLEYLTQNYQLIDIPLSPHINDIRPYSWENFKVEAAYTYHFEITAFDILQQQFSQDLRRKIKKSDGQGIRFKTSGDCKPLTRFVIDSYKESASSPAISADLIQKFMASAIQNGLGSLYYQYLDDQPISGIFVLEDDTTVYALFAGISAKKRKVTNNELLHAFVLQQPQYIGRQFDFLGANTKHLEQFKRSFGGDLVPYFKVSFKSNKTISSLFYARSKYHLAKKKFKSFY